MDLNFSAAAASAAGAAHGKVGTYIESSAHGGGDIVHLYRFHTIEQFLFNDVAEAPVIKNVVALFGLVQSHAQ